MDRTIYIGGAAGIVFWFLASFAIYGDKDFSARHAAIPETAIPRRLRPVYDISVARLFAISNGYDRPTISRDVAVVGKHTTRQRDPANRTYSVAMRAWPPLRTVVELGAPRAVYDRLAVPRTEIDTPQQQLEAMPDRGSIRLIVGDGRFGLEWLKSIELVEP